jgi:hypothetical protein
MRIDAAGLTSRYSRRNSPWAIYGHGEVNAFPPFRIMPVECEANARSGRYVFCRQIDEMDSETNLSRVVVVARSPLVRRPMDSRRGQKFDAQLLAGWDGARLLIEAPSSQRRDHFLYLIPFNWLWRHIENAAIA